MQIPVDFWLRFGQNFGFTALLISAVGIFVYKSLWPFIKEHITTLSGALQKQSNASLALLKEQATVTQALLTEQLNYSRERAEIESSKFFAALEKRDAEFAAIIAELKHVCESQREVSVSMDLLRRALLDSGGANGQQQRHQTL